MYLWKHPVFKNYACDNAGNVINLNTGTIRKTWVPKCGYKELNIRGCHVLVHRFVWECYNGMIIPKGYEVNHINKNKRDNRPYNLEVLTIQEHRNLHKKGTGGK